MYWVKGFSIQEKIYVDKVLDSLIYFQEIKERKFSDIYARACKLLYETNSKKIENINERVEKNSEEWKQIVLDLPTISDELGKEFNKFKVEIRKLEEEFIRESGKYITRRELTLYMKRCGLLRNKVDVMINSMQDNYAGELADILIQILYETGKLLTEEDKEKYKTIQEEEKKIIYNKIFNYKDMERLALEYGYEKVRTNGDHIMYKHNKTNKLVPIVGHELGYGLSRTIQKQLYKNSIAV